MVNDYSNVPKEIRNIRYCIYVITNTLNFKKYIGKTESKLINRIRRHCCNAMNGENTYLYSSIRKNGWETFSISILEVCKKEILCEREKYWISYYKSNNNKFGYNLTNGGDGNPFSQEILAKLANERKGKKLSLEHRAKIAKSCKGFKHSKEFINTISGKNNFNYKFISTDELKSLIMQGKNLLYIANYFNVIKDTIIYKVRKELMFDGFRDAQWNILYKSILLKSISDGQSQKEILSNLNLKSSSSLSKMINKLNFKSLKDARAQLCPNFSLKLSINDINSLLDDYINGNQIKDLSYKYKVSVPTIRKIIRRNNV